ncbi:universal stress protein [Rhodohalobacter sp. 8-1]|uniref:universal stress protein n=1 Tax=Rhodohalobacter sp. 8-1 TaxID=3131972 RepID=UPI0030EC9384
MATIDRILVPTDYSDYSENACQFAENLAAATGGVVDLLHVIPNSILMNEQLRETAKDNEEVDNDIYPLIFNEAELKLNSLARTHFQHKNRGDIFVKVDRSPAALITDQAWQGNYSLVVMSAKGKDESDMFRGSTTERVLRTSQVPVLSVYNHPDTLKSGRIIVPVDGSILSMAAVPAAALIASLYNASITFLYVHERMEIFNRKVPDKADDVQSGRFSEYLMERLMDFIDTMKPQGLHVIDSGELGLTGLVYNNEEIGISFEALTGYSAHHEITTYANKFADMVVMTTHGRSGLAHMLLGSHAEKVALNTEKTVLTIRPDSKLFDKQKQ